MYLEEKIRRTAVTLVCISYLFSGNYNISCFTLEHAYVLVKIENCSQFDQLSLLTVTYAFLKKNLIKSKDITKSYEWVLEIIL